MFLRYFFRKLFKRKRSVRFTIDGEERGVYSILLPKGRTVVYSLHQEDKKAVPFSWALLTVEDENPESCIFWMVYTREKFRRQGHAQHLIHILQQKYSYIYTQFERGIVNSAGVRLCLKCGFQMKQQIHKNQPPELSWERR